MAEARGPKHGRAWRRLLLLVLASLLGAGLPLAASACGSADRADTPSSPSPQPIKAGGDLRIAAPAGLGEFDPALMSGEAGDLLLVTQVLENLIDLDPGYTLRPSLASEWRALDATHWEFTLRDGVTFSNGRAFTAADVVYTLDRLRNTDLGSPVAPSLANVVSVIAADSSHVQIALATPDAEFPYLLTDPRCAMLCRRVNDHMNDLVGTGAFMLRRYEEGTRALLVRNPRYWGRDAEGATLPYLDRVVVRFSRDEVASARALVDGSADWVGDLTAAERRSVVAAGLVTVSAATSAGYELQIRCDRGAGALPALREALQCGTDREALVKSVIDGGATAGNATLIGPAFAPYYLDDAPPHDPEKARDLLAKAGLASAHIRLVVPAAAPLPALAAAWKAQMAEIGVTVSLKRVSPQAFYTDAGASTWYQADFCLVDWPLGLQPRACLALPTRTAGPWNFSRWSSAEFDDLVAAISGTPDPGARADLYRRAQAIVQGEVPMIVLALRNTTAGQRKGLAGVELSSAWTGASFRAAHWSE